MNELELLDEDFDLPLTEEDLEDFEELEAFYGGGFDVSEEDEYYFNHPLEDLGE